MKLSKTARKALARSTWTQADTHPQTLACLIRGGFLRVTAKGTYVRTRKPIPPIEPRKPPTYVDHALVHAKAELGWLPWQIAEHFDLALSTVYAILRSNAPNPRGAPPTGNPATIHPNPD